MISRSSRLSFVFLPLQQRSTTALCHSILREHRRAEGLAAKQAPVSAYHPNWGWIRISSFYLKYCGVINKMNERRRIGITLIVPPPRRLSAPFRRPDRQTPHGRTRYRSCDAPDIPKRHQRQQRTRGGQNPRKWIKIRYVPA